ncbi:MAG: hypothetical protein ACI4C4_07815 [Lachnospiraceae bacterium]
MKIRYRLRIIKDYVLLSVGRLLHISRQKQFGFIRRPNDCAGAALDMWVEK